MSKSKSWFLPKLVPSIPTPTNGRSSLTRSGPLHHFGTLSASTLAHPRSPGCLSRNLSQSSQASPINLRTSRSTPNIMSHSKNVPSINVVTSEPPAAPQQIPPQTDSLTLSPVSPSSGGQGHSRSPSDPKFLSAPSPILAHAASPTDDAPPSPTLSASSVHFKTTTDLRGRNPGDGISSLQAVQQHGRKNSAASFQTVTEPDHATLGVPTSAATSFTAGPSMDKAPIGKGDGSNAPSTVTHINPSDDNTDPTPFAFKPYALAALVDPKTLKDLDTMGGLEGLCNGLGTNPTKGLSAHSLGQGAGDGEKSGGEGALAAPLSDRQRVYGTNELPTRPSKSLFQLMWLALKDKVLVRSNHSRNHLHLALLILP